MLTDTQGDTQKAPCTVCAHACPTIRAIPTKQLSTQKPERVYYPFRNVLSTYSDFETLKAGF